MARNAFFISTVSNCCWYWDSNSTSHNYKNRIQTLLVDYDTVIERIKRYNTVLFSFAFEQPQSDKLFTNYVNKIENTKGKSGVFNKMSNQNKLSINKLSINKLSINKLRIDLITGKYIDFSAKRPQRPSTSIDTVEKFEDIIEKNNELKAMLRKNNK
jgi:hypothetical protein